MATQDPLRQRALVVADKAARVRYFHRNSLKALAQILVRRISPTHVQLFSEAHVVLQPGELLDGVTPHRFYAESWSLARADHFEPAV